MKTADEIEREINDRFAEEVYVGMGQTGYLTALATVIIRYVAEELATAADEQNGTKAKA